jgi:peptidoglycan hydrolase-like protein with peptidoglycan-binding domain
MQIGAAPVLAGLLVAMLAGCSDLIDQTAGGPRLAGEEPRVGADDAVVVEQGLVVGGDGEITIFPSAGKPIELAVAGTVVATYEDGAGGLVYVTTAPDQPGLTVQHLPAGSTNAYTVAHGLGQVLGNGILNGKPALLAAAEPAGSPIGALQAIQLDGTVQTLFQPPPTAVKVDQGGQRLVIGHQDAALGCGWIEVVDLQGQPEEVLPPGAPSQDGCGGDGAQPQAPPSSLSDDGRRLAIAEPAEQPGMSQIRIVDLDLHDETLVLAANLQRLDLDLEGGMAITTDGIVEIGSAGGQTWLTPFPGEAGVEDPIQRLQTELRLDPALVDGRHVALSSERPPGARAVEGPVSIGPGSVGEAVSDWQSKLNRWLGVAETVVQPRIAISGIFDEATVALSNVFFEATARAADGSVDQADLEELDRQLAVLEAGPGLIQEGARGRVVAIWQQDLAAWRELAQPEGVSRVSADGIYGKGTAEVTAAFETAVGNSSDGIVQPADRAAMTQTLIGLGVFARQVPPPQLS